MLKGQTSSVLLILCLRLLLAHAAAIPKVVGDRVKWNDMRKASESVSVRRYPTTESGINNDSQPSNLTCKTDTGSVTIKNEPRAAESVRDFAVNCNVTDIFKELEEFTSPLGFGQSLKKTLGLFMNRTSNAVRGFHANGTKENRRCKNCQIGQHMNDPIVCCTPSVEIRVRNDTTDEPSDVYHQVLKSHYNSLGQPHNFTIGKPTAGDWLAKTVSVFKQSGILPWSRVHEDIVYQIPDEAKFKRITCIQALDRSNKDRGGSVLLLEGGVHTSNVTLRIVSNKGEPINYDVYIFTH